MDILRSIKLNFLTTIRNKTTLFWNTIFPIFLASFFCIIFSSINPKFEKIDIGMNKSNQYIEIAKKIDYINVKEIKTDIAKDLSNKEYKAFVNDDLSLEVISSSSEITIVKNIFEQIKQMSETKINPVEIAKNLDKEFIEQSNQNITGAETIVLSVLIMTSFYTMFDGVVYVDNISYNSSEIAKRLLISPLKKSYYLLSAMISALIVSGLNSALMIAFVQIVFKVKIITNILYSSIIVICIMTLGFTMGMVFSILFKNSKTSSKTGIGLGLILFMCYTSGMTGQAFSNDIQKNFPTIANLNPALHLQNALISVNVTRDLSYLTPAIIYSLSLSAIFFIIALVGLRRTKYNDF